MTARHPVAEQIENVCHDCVLSGGREQDKLQLDI